MHRHVNEQARTAVAIRWRNGVFQDRDVFEYPADAVLFQEIFSHLKRAVETPHESQHDGLFSTVVCVYKVYEFLGGFYGICEWFFDQNAMACFHQRTGIRYHMLRQAIETGALAAYKPGRQKIFVRLRDVYAWVEGCAVCDLRTTTTP